MITQRFNKLYKPVFSSKARHIHIWGGRARGGSHFATDYFLHLVTQPIYFRGYIMREIFSDIRTSLFQDLKDRIEECPDLTENDFDINENQMSFVCHQTGNQINAKGFKKSSGKQTAKLKSLAGATHVIIEEAEEIGEDDFRQLDDSLRTIKSDIKIIMLFNPPNRDHWIIKRWYTLSDSHIQGYYTATPKELDDFLSIHSTYKSNIKNLNKSTVRNYEVTYKEEYEKSGNEYYPINVLGLVSEGVKGRVFKGWNVIPHLTQAYSKTYGLDFGFSDDPAGLIEVEQHNKDVFVRELFYLKGLTNPDISDKLEDLGLIRGESLIIADSAEPKSIKELQDLGWNVQAADKGPDSIRAGINKIKSLNIHVTQDSYNLWKEYENYRWRLDINKMPTNVPVDKFNHLIDPLRYVLTTKEHSFRLI